MSSAACTRPARSPRRSTPKDAKEAREFFEQNFRPVRITPLGETAGFLTGYYEPIVDGSREPTEGYVHPLYRKPAGLLRGGKRLKAASLRPQAKAGSRKIGQGRERRPRRPSRSVTPPKEGSRGKARKKAAGELVSFYDRAAIDDGVLEGRNLEIV